MSSKKTKLAKPKFGIVSRSGKGGKSTGRPRKNTATSPSGRRSTSLEKYYVCRSCELPFLHEEATMGRYIRRSKKCARCIVDEVIEAGNLEPPFCYGDLYNAREIACARCTLSQACLIGSMEKEAWRLRLHDARNHKGNYTITVQLCRILRSAGRVMHVKDIAPLLNKTSGGDWVQAGTWWSSIQNFASRNPEVVTLGSGYYVWAGCWDGKFGELGSSAEKKLSPVIDILRELQEEDSE